MYWGCFRKTKTRSVFYLPLILAALISSVNAYAVNLTAQSKTEIRGEETGLDMKFSSVLEGENYVVVDIELRNEKKIVAQIDYAAQTVSIKSISQKDGVPVSITEQDVFLITMLGESLGPIASRTGDALASTLSFLSEAPPGEVINISAGDDSVPQRQQEQQQAIESLCDVTGNIVSAVYDTEEREFEELVQVGPCYNKSRGNKCFGRCGKGCGYPPRPTFQIFAQDCLNHDLCTARVGRDPAGILPPCNDEWQDAADDFLFGDDCANASGEWYDSSRKHWILAQPDLASDSPFQVRGTTDIGGPQCGTLEIPAGFHRGAKIVLRVLNPPPVEEGCCRSYRYTGTFKNCNRVDGRLTNTCGLNERQWILIRDHID
jgi:hypothetical protein